MENRENSKKFFLLWNFIICEFEIFCENHENVFTILNSDLVHSLVHHCVMTISGDFDCRSCESYKNSPNLKGTWTYTSGNRCKQNCLEVTTTLSLHNQIAENARKRSFFIQMSKIIHALDEISTSTVQTILGGRFRFITLCHSIRGKYQRLSRQTRIILGPVYKRLWGCDYRLDFVLPVFRLIENTLMKHFDKKTNNFNRMQWTLGTMLNKNIKI